MCVVYDVALGCVSGSRGCISGLAQGVVLLERKRTSPRAACRSPPSRRASPPPSPAPPSPTPAGSRSAAPMARRDPRARCFPRNGSAHRTAHEASSMLEGDTTVYWRLRRGTSARRRRGAVVRPTCTGICVAVTSQICGIRTVPRLERRNADSTQQSSRSPPCAQIGIHSVSSPAVKKSLRKVR